MNNRKLGAITVLTLLALGLSGLVPGMAGAGRENSLVQRVEELEGLVADLAARVEELEQTGDDCCSCDVLHLTPLADFPADPSEGDLCVVDTSIDGWGLFWYLGDGWHYLTIPPRPPPPPGPRP